MTTRCSHSYTVERVAASIDLLDILDRHADARSVFFVERPADAEAVLAIGAAHEIRTSGRTRIADASREARAVLERAVCIEGDDRDVPREIGPRFVGGFGFADSASSDPRWAEFPSCRLVLPERLWITRGAQTWLVRTQACSCTLRSPESRFENACEPGSPGGQGDPQDPEDRESWRRRVAHVLALVDEGRAEKIVLSRSRCFERSAREEPATTAVRLVRRMRASRPGCFSFCVGTSTARFIGSTPELLVRRTGDRVDAQALAGTVGRGADENEDRELAAALSHSKKNLYEQATVTSAITDVLRPLAERIEVAPEPAVLALPEAFHLHTPITARLAGAPDSPLPDALELAGLLHPTPAVCGTPRGVARSLIEREEGDRGWYTGAIGWLAAGGDGSFAVALRAALLEDRRTTLWAGAGIVTGSDADAEFDETELKMRAVRAAIDDVPGRSPNQSDDRGTSEGATDVDEPPTERVA